MMTTLTRPGANPLDRREFLGHLETGLGGVALWSLLSGSGIGGEPKPSAGKPVHFKARANRVLQVFCSGACSHIDTWDYKPELVKRHGEKLPGNESLVTFQGGQGALTRSPYVFRPRGQSGKFISDLLPRLADLADEMCFIHSMTAKSNTHGPAEAQMNTGFTLEGFPSMGSWVSYALGTENQDLPAFVAIPDPRGVPQIGPADWSNAFLPAVFQGMAFNAERPVANLARPAGVTAEADRAVRDMVGLLNEQHRARNPGDTELTARIAAYELAGRMQLSMPAVADLTTESAKTHSAYGTDSKNATLAGFARNCLLARRLLEKGVRFVQLINGGYAMGEGVGNWDGHKQLKADYDRHGPILDQPLAALLKDLKQRGLLDDTLVVWSTEFGRMPTFQVNAQGRDHNPRGFTVWLAGAGVKKGYSHGATDDFGYQAAEKVATIYDFHATILHLLGLDHERLTYYHNGIQRRLTDVHGKVIRDILA